jgi:hypothetical protein
MALRYTGRADMLVVAETGKRYIRDPKWFAKNYPGEKYDGTFADPLTGLTTESALKMMESSNMHSFENTKGEDILDKETAPAAVSATGDANTSSTPKK